MVNVTGSQIQNNLYRHYINIKGDHMSLCFHLAKHLSLSVLTDWHQTTCVGSLYQDCYPGVCDQSQCQCCYI